MGGVELTLELGHQLAEVAVVVDVGKEARVRILVKIPIHSSHVLEVVEKVCSRAIIIHKGSIVADDSVANLRKLMRLPSLEEIFSQLVVKEDTEAKARDILAAIRSQI